ncbi:hypothetical protein BZZ08_02431 [Streptomyces sp. MH60]|nr:hypothetical protein BZZ08_02431 [Streptomyces sp. MH60]
MHRLAGRQRADGVQERQGPGHGPGRGPGDESPAGRWEKPSEGWLLADRDRWAKGHWDEAPAGVWGGTPGGRLLGLPRQSAKGCGVRSPRRGLGQSPRRPAAWPTETVGEGVRGTKSAPGTGAEPQEAGCLAYRDSRRRGAGYEVRAGDWGRAPGGRLPGLPRQSAKGCGVRSPRRGLGQSPRRPAAWPTETVGEGVRGTKSAPGTGAEPQEAGCLAYRDGWTDGRTRRKRRRPTPTPGRPAPPTPACPRPPASVRRPSPGTAAAR